MEKEKDILIAESQLKNILDFCASALVGKALKRFEIHSHVDVIKAELKELIYEQFRHTKDMIISYNNGREFKWELKSKEIKNVREES